MGHVDSACLDYLGLREMMRLVAYNHELADRTRALVAPVDNLAERNMFGGLAFLVNGNMAVAASGAGGLLVRVDQADADAWIDGERVTPMIMRGREMRGWLIVDTEADRPGVGEWASGGVAFARSLPPKTR